MIFSVCLFPFMFYFTASTQHHTAPASDKQMWFQLAILPCMAKIPKWNVPEISNEITESELKLKLGNGTSKKKAIKWQIFLFNFRSIAPLNNIYNNFEFPYHYDGASPFFFSRHTPFTKWSMHLNTNIDWNALKLRSMLMLMRWWCLYGAHILMHKLGVLDVVTMFTRNIDSTQPILSDDMHFCFSLLKKTRYRFVRNLLCYFLCECVH